MKLNRLWHRVFYLILAVFLIVAAAPTAFAQETEKQGQNLANLLRHYVEELDSNPAAQGMVVGYEVYSLDRNKTLASLRRKKTIVPASTLKLLVTSTVIDLWNEDLRFPTKVYLDGQFTPGGVMHGDVVLKGYGDPVLTVKKLGKLAKSLADQGIRRIQGDLVVDGSYFSGKHLGAGWMWDDEPYAYNAQFGALSVNHNTVDVKVKPAQLGEKPKVTVNPAPGYVHVVNRAKTVKGAAEDLSINRTRAKNEIVVTGTIGQDYKGSYERTRTIVNPTLFTGHVFRDLLQKHGISFVPKSQVIKGKVSEGANLLANVYSPELDKILKKLVKESNNFIAEMLTKQLGARERGRGTTQAGLDVIGEFVHDELGVDGGFLQKDGSGLSRLDHIAPHHYIQLLKAMYNHPESERFISYLPVAGVDGTLKYRMRGTPAEGNLKAKTGSMSGVTSLVGYVKGSNGEQFAFAIMMNGAYKLRYARDLQDKIAVALAKYPNIPEVEAPEEQKTYPLSDELDPILNDEDFETVIKGAKVYSVDSETVLYARNSQSLITPGSSMKLLTSATALAKLGEDYRFQTEIYTTGYIRDGVLHGDVIIKGYGDPTLATKASLGVLNGPTIDEMAEDIKNLGIRRIQGDILVDATAFTGDIYGSGWRWDRESKYYQPQITALSVNRGTVRFDYRPGKEPGDKVRLKLSPNTDYVRVVNKTLTGQEGSENTLKFHRVRGTNTIRVTGNLPATSRSGYVRVTVEQPQLYTGNVLRNQLKKKGVSFHPQSDVQSAKVPDDAKLYKTYDSPQLSKIIRYMNKYNDNFYAEMILNTIGLEVKGEGTFDAGIDVVHEYVESLGIKTRFDMMDGSGLTRYNQVSVNQLVSLLTALNDESTFDTFFNSLSVAGEKGVLENHMEGTAAEHHLRGITGSFPMPYLQSLTGYFKTSEGELLAYSILVNGSSEKSLSKLVDRFGAALSEAYIGH
ncbi:MAG TPA: D-alanyl-D-alanine carboxypeptidase/D-alanyl-D-alanine-endopeptidase [Bacillales bacterium]